MIRKRSIGMVLALASLVISSWPASAATINKEDLKVSTKITVSEAKALRNGLKATRHSPKSRGQEEDLLNSGFAKLDKWDLQGAVDDFTKVLAINAKNIDALANRALCHYYMNNYADALQDAEEAAGLDAKWQFPHYVKGISYIALGNYESAVDSFTAALALEKSNKYNLEGRGEAYYYWAKYDLAKTDLSKAILLDPKYYNAYWFRAFNAIALKDFEAAKKDANKLISLSDNGDSHRVLALAYEAAGDKANAIAEYKKAADLYKAAGNTQWEKIANDAASKLEQA